MIMSSHSKASPLEELEYFVSLANRGKSDGTSLGSAAARRLALALLQDVPALDGRALEGLKFFADAAKYLPETARGSID